MWHPIIHNSLKACSHRVKTNAKVKKIKEPANEIKEKKSNIKENFLFRSVWMGTYGVEGFNLVNVKSFSIQ